MNRNVIQVCLSIHLEINNNTKILTSVVTSGRHYKFVFCLNNEYSYFV